MKRQSTLRVKLKKCQANLQIQTGVDWTKKDGERSHRVPDEVKSDCKNAGSFAHELLVSGFPLMYMRCAGLVSRSCPWCNSNPMNRNI